MGDKGFGHDDLQAYFGLSYASWLTLPRVIMEAMPDEWQGKMAGLLNELSEEFPGLDRLDVGTRVQITCDGKLIKTPEWMISYRHPDFEVIARLKRNPGDQTSKG